MMFYYMGLMVFALNGLLLIGTYNKFRELRVAEERIIKLLMRSKIRGKR